MAWKCGICQMNSTAKMARPPASTRPVMAVQPRSAGMAPGMAPIHSATWERCFIGV